MLKGYCLMNVVPTEHTRRYYPSICPVCCGAALVADLVLRKVEFQCARCGAYEITAAARSAMRGMLQEHRETWLTQARQEAVNHATIVLVDCANDQKI
jgi:nanoRNase/pAp phosphatase (c-di-AMP/oligoRNAs hydrolase)